MKRSNYLNWDEYFMGVALLSAQRSKDSSTQVGACIVNNENKILSVGYNGMPCGCDDEEMPWNREGEPLDTKYMYVCHAELNAILNNDSGSLKGTKIYVTLFPCNECAKAIIQSGIKEVIYLSDKYAETDSVKGSKRMFDMAGIKYTQYDGDDIPAFQKNDKAKVILICGKICSGKSTYSAKLKVNRNAVIMSCDEIMTDMFDKQLGDKHEEVVCKVKKYIYNKSLEVAKAGTNVIIDSGLWTKVERKTAKEFFNNQGIETELHYIKVDDETWNKHIESRNDAVEKGRSNDYYVDENLKKKVSSIFEEPDETEVDVIIWIVE